MPPEILRPYRRNNRLKNLSKTPLSLLTTFPISYTIAFTRREVEQLAARRAHNPEAAGSSPALAIRNKRRYVSNNTGGVFYLTYLLIARAGLETK